MTADARTRASLPHAIAAIAIATMVIALVNAEAHVGVTVDEHGHLLRGLAWWWAPDTRYAWPHPPLPHAIVALPTVIGSAPVDFTALAGWDDADFTRAVKAYWAHVGYDIARAQLVAGRRTMIAVAALVAAWLWWWSQRRMGKTIAMVVLLAWLSHTVLLAHATLVTNDFAAACAALVVTTTLLDVLRRPRPRRVVAFGLACGAALVTKLSLVPIVAIAILVPIAVTRSLAGLRRGAAVLVIAWFVVLATYRFDRIVLTVGDYNAKDGTPGWRSGPEHPLALPAAIPLVLPHSWVFSAQFIRKQNARGHAGWFWGERNEGGDPLYFPTLALFKTPIGTLVLFGAGALAMGIAIRRRRRVDPVLAVGLGFAAAFFAMASTSRINIGFRHATPSIGWVVLVAGRGAAWCWRRRRVGRAIVIGASAASTVGAVIAWPLYLGDFNAIAGGRAGGLGINLAEEDWGQDMPDLAAYLVEQRAQPVYLYARSTTMSHELRHFGVAHRILKCKEPATGWIAIGVKDWVERSECFGWLDASVVHTVNDHVFVFDAR